MLARQGRIACCAPGGDPEITRLAEFTEYHYPLNGQATAYVCQNYYCDLPANDVDTMLELMGN
jgi:uncharacterized protein YyaL (SSP411 family)